MVVGLVLGAGIGLGIFLVGRAVLVRRLPLATALAALDRPRPTHLSVVDAPSWEARVGRRGVALLDGLGVDPARRARDLRVLDRTVERHTVEKIGAAGVGLATPLVMAVVAAAGGAVVPVGIVMLSAVGFAAAGFVLPDALARDAAKARRQTFAHALSAYLDLVNVLLAGSAGTETALVAAADAGDGWAFAELRTALERARLTRRSPWDAFAALGDELDVPELRELAASVRLAGEQGARIKSSLAAKAASLRGQQLARAEAAAQAASERMAVPNVAMFLGFLLFVGYPAVASIVGGV